MPIVNSSSTRIRSLAKQVIHRGLTSGGLDRLARWTRGLDRLILAYHNVIPSSEVSPGDRALHLPLSRFEAQLDGLARMGTILPLEEVIAAPRESGRGNLRIAITFDDAYRGAVTLGVEALRRRGLPATIFVTPGLLGDQTPWWDGLAARTSRRSTSEAVGATGVADADFDTLRNQILTGGPGRYADAEALAREAGIELSPMPSICRIADEGELMEALETPGVTLGAHTWSHPVLPNLDQSELMDELERPLRWLRRVAPDRHVGVVSYPYGLYSERVGVAARDAGYSAGLLILQGMRIPQSISTPSAFTMARLSIPAGLSSRGLRFKASWG